MLRGAHRSFDGTAPVQWKSWLGDHSTLRGYNAGELTGDVGAHASLDARLGFDVLRAVRVPLLKNWGLQPIGFVDWGKTWDAAGGAVGPGEGARDWRMDFLAEGWGPSQVWATVREERWKYTELPIVPGDPMTGFELELYDLWNDPYELDSLHALPEHAARINAMSVRLRELRPSWPRDSASMEEDPDE